MTGAIVVIVIVAAAFAYLLVERWQIKSSEPARNEMLDIGQRMLGSPKYSDLQKQMISDLLDEANDSGFMVQMVFRLPWTIWRMLRPNGSLPTDQIEIDRDFSRFLSLHQKCTAAANPLFFVIFRIEIAIMTLFLGLLLGTLVMAVTASRVARKLSESDSNRNGRPVAEA